MVAGKAAASETEQAKVEVKPGDLLKLSLSLDLHEAGGSFHPPTQEATAVKLWRNVQWVSSDPSARAYGRHAEALAPGLRSLKWLLRRSRRGHTSGGPPKTRRVHGCPSSAVVCYGGWIKPWGSLLQSFSIDSAGRARIA